VQTFYSSAELSDCVNRMSGENCKVKPVHNHLTPLRICEILLSKAYLLLSYYSCCNLLLLLLLLIIIIIKIRDSSVGIALG
jgi:hypothetical protein